MSHSSPLLSICCIIHTAWKTTNQFRFLSSIQKNSQNYLDPFHQITFYEVYILSSILPWFSMLILRGWWFKNTAWSLCLLREILNVATLQHSALSKSKFRAAVQPYPTPNPSLLCRSVFSSSDCVTAQDSCRHWVFTPRFYRRALQCWKQMSWPAAFIPPTSHHLQAITCYWELKYWIFH